MSIELDDRTYKYPSDRITVNDRVVREVYCNGEKVYPEIDVGSHVIKWKASGMEMAHIRYDHVRNSYSEADVGTIRYAMAASMSFTPVDVGGEYAGRVQIGQGGRFEYVDVGGNAGPYRIGGFIALKTYEVAARVMVTYDKGKYPERRYYDEDLPRYWKLSESKTHPLSMSYRSDMIPDGYFGQPAWDYIDAKNQVNYTYPLYVPEVNLDQDVFSELGANWLGSTTNPYNIHSINVGFYARFWHCLYRGPYYINDHVELPSVSMPNPTPSGVTYKNFDFNSNGVDVNPITDANPPSSAYTVSFADLPSIK